MRRAAERHDSKENGWVWHRITHPFVFSPLGSREGLREIRRKEIEESRNKRGVRHLLRVSPMPQ